MFLVSWEQGDFARLWQRVTGRGGGASTEPVPAE
jgi:hypothetical protein